MCFGNNVPWKYSVPHQPNQNFILFAQYTEACWAACSSCCARFICAVLCTLGCAQLSCSVHSCAVHRYFVLCTSALCRNCATVSYA